MNNLIAKLSENTREIFYEKRWDAIIKRQGKHEIIYINELQELFELQRDEVLSNMKHNPKMIKDSLDTWLFGQEEWQKAFYATTGALISDAFAEGVEIGVADIGVADIGVAFDISNPVVADELYKFIEYYTQKSAYEITEFTAFQLREALSTGIRLGESMYELRKRVEGIYEFAKDVRAEMIARTETMRATNAGNQALWKASGQVKGKQWYTALDERVCFPSRTKIKTKDGYKIISRVKAGDYVLTHKDRYKRVLGVNKRKYDGYMVRITLSGGKNKHQLTATEDHNILVNGEWKSIKDIVVGDVVQFLAKPCPVCKKLMPYFNDVCSAKCNTKRNNVKIWKDPKQHKRVIAENKKFGKQKKMRRAFDEKLKDVEFVKYFGGRVSDGLKLSYKENKEHYDRVAKSNREKGKRDGWGWKNKKRHLSALKKAFENRGKNHLGKSFLEKKMEWWLKINDFNYEAQKYYNNGKRRFWVDFHLTDYNIIIEADGEYFHNDEQDRKRDRQLKEVFTGKILHFKGNDIRNNFDDCINILNNAILQQNCFTGIKVSKVERYKLNREMPVYNLQVEDDKTYLANNIIVHNCEFCSSMEGNEYLIDDTFFEQGESLVGNQGGIMTFDYSPIDTPPLHPRCRCVLLPILN